MKQRTTWGTIYRPRGRDGTPTQWWWIKYRRPGDAQPTRVCTEPRTDDAEEAKRQMNALLGQTAADRLQREHQRHAEGVTVNDLLDLYVIGCARARRPIQQGRVEPWRHELGSALAVAVTRLTLDDLSHQWQRHGLTWSAGTRTMRDGTVVTWTDRDPKRVRPLSGASVNRLMATLRAAYTLGVEKLPGFTHTLSFPHAPETPRKTDLTEDQCLAICQNFQAKAGAEVKADVFRLAFLLGIRKGQLRCTLKRYVRTTSARWSIEWPGETTKNGKPHIVPLVGEALEIVERAWARRRPDVDELFHVDGRPLGSMTSELRRTCEAVGIPYGRRAGVTFHTTRHAAVSNLLAANVSEAVAMTITGHLDPSAFKRYHERREHVQADALERQTTYLAQQRGTTNMPPVMTQREGTTGHDKRLGRTAQGRTQH